MMFRVYAVLAVIGAVLPYAIVVPWVHAHGVDLPLFLSSVFASGGAAVFSADVLFAAAVFLVFAFAEGRRLGMRNLWLFPLIIVTVGLCCALPAFLAMRERALDRRAAPPDGAA